MSDEKGDITADAVERLAALVDLPIDPAYRQGVADHLAGLLRAADLVMRFPLPDDAEPASVFRP